MRYIVDVVVTSTRTDEYTVEADSEEEAKQKAEAEDFISYQQGDTSDGDMSVLNCRQKKPVPPGDL